MGGRQGLPPGKSAACCCKNRRAGGVNRVQRRDDARLARSYSRTRKVANGSALCCCMIIAFCMCLSGYRLYSHVPLMFHLPFGCNTKGKSTNFDPSASRCHACQGGLRGPLRLSANSRGSIEGLMVIFKISKCARGMNPGVSAHAYGSY